MQSDHEAAVHVAVRLLTSGPHWIADVWDELAPVTQREVLEVLVDRPSFELALTGARIPPIPAHLPITSTKRRRTGRSRSRRNQTRRIS